MLTFVRTSVLVVALTLAATLSSTTLAAAATDRSTAAAAAGALDEARRVANLSYREFLAYKQEGGSDEYDFDLSSDGCTYPAPTQDYDGACQQHDFGYRNFGGHGLRLDATRETKDFLDLRFRDEARRECADRYPTWNVNGKKIVCQYQADVSLTGISNGADGAFFG